MPVNTEWVDDIKALLNDAVEQFDVVKELHDAALEDPDARSKFKTRVKNVLENQRSVLDYLAVGITKQFGTPKRGFIYYPLAQSENEFPVLMENKMPGVAAAEPDIAAAVKRHQPYHSRNLWLRELNQLTREQKHNQLSPQLVREGFQCRVTEKKTGAFVQWRGFSFTHGRLEFVAGALMQLEPEPGRDPTAPKLFDYGVGPTGVLVFGIPIDPKTQRPYEDDKLEVEGGPMQEWCFIKPHKSVVTALFSFQGGVAETCNDVLQAARL
jgi:hypothetical protein